MTNLVAEETVVQNEAVNGTAHVVRIILRHALSVLSVRSQNRKALGVVAATMEGDGAEAQIRMVVAVHLVSPVQVTGTAPAELTTSRAETNALNAKILSQKALEALEAVHLKIAQVFARTRRRNFIFQPKETKRKSSTLGFPQESTLKNTTISR